MNTINKQEEIIAVATQITLQEIDKRENAVCTGCCTYTETLEF